MPVKVQGPTEAAGFLGISSSPIDGHSYLKSGLQDCSGSSLFHHQTST